MRIFEPKSRRDGVAHEGTMKIAFIGSGQVGGALADQLQRAGHDVTIASRPGAPAPTGRTLERNPAVPFDDAKRAIESADVVFLATPFSQNEAALAPVADALAGKVLVDCTNPVGPGMTHGLRSERSGSELVQRTVPAARVVKAFSIYGFENFEDSTYPGYGVKPAMLFCGADAAAKRTVGNLVEDLGWAPVDVGGLEQALHLEHMTLLWVNMVRVGGQSPHRVWALLTR